MNILGSFIPADILQKVIFLAIFLLAGLGMHRLLPVKQEWPKYAAGVLYVINPFTYSRLMTGQYLVLAGYALMPWFIKSLFKFLNDPNRRTALPLAAWTVAIGFLSIHFLGFAILASVIGTIVTGTAKRRERPFLKRLAIWTAATTAGILIVNSFWLIPSLTGNSSQSELIQAFDKRHLLTFRTDPDRNLGQLVNTAGLYGMWTDREDLYISPKQVAWYWPGILLLIVITAVTGAVKYWTKHRLPILTLSILGLVSWVLAQGILGSPFTAVNQFLYDHLPFFSGYREPGKFIGLIALSLCFLFGLGVNSILEHTERKNYAAFLAPIFVALPLLYTPTMAWGAAGQLKAVDYPSDWYALNAKLNAEKGEGKVLFLPWHQYMHFKFADRLIANPAARFFDRPTIQGDNAEIGLIERQTSNATSDKIEKQILADDRKDVAQRLKTLGIKYVVLAKEADYKDYGWLDSQPGLGLVSDTATLRVYEVKL